MSALQCNAAFHLYPSSHIVLPPYLLYGMETRTFWCAVYGSSRAFKMSVHPDTNVDDLKKDIVKQEMALCHLPYSHLVLWKVSFGPRPVFPLTILPAKHPRTCGSRKLFLAAY